MIKPLDWRSEVRLLYFLIILMLIWSISTSYLLYKQMKFNDQTVEIDKQQIFINKSNLEFYQYQIKLNSNLKKATGLIVN